MTVAELRKILRRFPGDATVYVIGQGASEGFPVEATEVTVIDAHWGDGRGPEIK